MRKQGATTDTSSLYAYDEAGHLIGEYAADGTPINEHIWHAYVKGLPIQAIDRHGLQLSMNGELDPNNFPSNYPSNMPSTSRQVDDEASRAYQYIKYLLGKTNCDGSQAWSMALGERQKFPNDLALRDAEHYLYAYWQVQESGYNLPAQLVVTTLYSGVKTADQATGKHIWPDASPASITELMFGYAGAIAPLQPNGECGCHR